MKTSYLILILGCLISASGQTQERIYKWTDEKGEIHYTAQSPPGIEAELFVLLKDKLPSPVAPAAALNSANDAPEPPEAPEEKQGPTREELKQQAKELCERGHFLVDTLEPRPQAILTQPDGSVRSLSNSERLERIDRGYMLIKKYCSYRP